MFLADYHAHSRFSHDGSESIRSMALAAEAAGLSELAVTDHYDVGPFMYAQYDEALHRKELLDLREEFSGRVRILYGVEFGEQSHNPSMPAAAMSRNNFDFVIGSHHILKGGEDFYAICCLSRERCTDILSRYLDELLDLAENHDFDVLGHFSYPLRYMNGRDHMNVGFEPFYDKAEAVFKALVKNGKGIELNISGLGSAWGRPMPEPELLKLYRSCGGEIVTVGTDAHCAAKTGRHVKEGYELLRQAGFRYVTAFCERNARYEAI